jgi:haloacetate dehalogenase
VFDGFDLRYVDVAPDVRLRVRVGGAGPPVVLLHGHPRTHTTWHLVAPLLARTRTVICPDLMGYGDSTAPAPLPDHAQASKRVMAHDIVELCRQLGHDEVGVVGHDRGAYVALRMALDHPQLVRRLTILDAVPIGEALDRADARFAEAWWHWFFFAQPGKPEQAILADPEAWYGAGPHKAVLMGEENYADFRTAIHRRDVVVAMLEDYRAGLGVDRAADDEDRAVGRRVQCPTTVIWATEDDMELLYGDVLAVWRPWCTALRGATVGSGHHMAEEAPHALAAELLRSLD